MITFFYEYIIIIANLFGAYGKSKLDLVKIICIPLSRGLFIQEVYLEGLKRRSEALHPPLAGKMNCNHQ